MSKRRGALETIPGWADFCQTTMPRSFDEAVADLRRLVEAHGWDEVPSRDPVTYSFVTQQKTALKAGRLAPEKEAALRSIPGFEGWLDRMLGTFLAHVAELRRDIEAHGWKGISGRDRGKHQGRAHRWRAYQRAGKLSAAQLEALRSVPGWDEFCGRLTEGSSVAEAA